MENKALKKLASEWFEKGNHDLEDARRLKDSTIGKIAEILRKEREDLFLVFHF